MKFILPLLAFSLTGCGSLVRSGSEDPQALVDKRAVGVAAGEFFQRYGAPVVREEALDGSRQFIWRGGLKNVAAGPLGPEELVCALRIFSDRSGRIVSAPIVRDGQGQRRASRCAELFD